MNNTMKKFNEFTNESKNDMVITRNNEQNIISYEIPGHNSYILGRTPQKEWVVKTRDGILVYNTNELEEIFGIDIIKSLPYMERLGFTS